MSPIQSIPILLLFSFTYIALAFVKEVIGSNPQFSAKAWGITSKASEKALMAYCSTPGILSASF